MRLLVSIATIRGDDGTVDSLISMAAKIIPPDNIKQRESSSSPAKPTTTAPNNSSISPRVNPFYPCHNPSKSSSRCAGVLSVQEVYPARRGGVVTRANDLRAVIDPGAPGTTDHPMTRIRRESLHKETTEAGGGRPTTIIDTRIQDHRSKTQYCAVVAVLVSRAAAIAAGGRALPDGLYSASGVIATQNFLIGDNHVHGHIVRFHREQIFENLLLKTQGNAQAAKIFF